MKTQHELIGVDLATGKDETDTRVHAGGARVSTGKDSKQDYATPQTFIDAVVRDWCLGEAFSFDLAATKENAKATDYFTTEVNSLLVNWHAFKGLMWLNPPFSLITPWAKKCSDESILGARIAMLVPASVDSNWWAHHVHKKAAVRFVSPRIAFDGTDPYPKPLALLLYGDWHLTEEKEWYAPWRWKP